jgi:hypothetical protein
LRDFALSGGFDAVSVRHDSTNQWREGEAEQVHLNHSTGHLRAYWASLYQRQWFARKLFRYFQLAWYTWVGLGNCFVFSSLVGRT